MEPTAAAREAVSLDRGLLRAIDLSQDAVYRQILQQLVDEQAEGEAHAERLARRRERDRYRREELRMPGHAAWIAAVRTGQTQLDYQPWLEAGRPLTPPAA